MFFKMLRLNLINRVFKKHKTKRKMPKYTEKFDDSICEKSLPDVIDYNLDIVFINLNQHHYSGQGNQFFRILHESELTSKLIKPSETHRLLEYGLGLVNMVEKPAEKKCLEMSAEEQKKAQEILRHKILSYRPKIVAYNSRPAYEAFVGLNNSHDFCHGKIPSNFDNSDIYQFSFPSTSARISILPKVSDKVPFFRALKNFRDYLNGNLEHICEEDLIFPDFKVTYNSRELNESQNNDDSFDEETQGDVDLSQCEDKDDGKPKKSFRLNNLPVSQIPKDILEDIRRQQKIKIRKTVTVVGSKEFLSMQWNAPKVLSTFAAGSTCSDPETHSTMTNDSDHDILNPATPSTPSNDKIISSINQNKNQKITKSIGIEPNHAKTVKVILNENKTIPVVKTSAKIIQNAKNQVVNLQNKVDNIPIETQIDLTNSIELELIKKDQYRFDDYYRFENTANQNLSLNYLISDDYYQSMKQDLGRKLKFDFLKDSQSKLGECYDVDLNNKVGFSTLTDASSYVLLNSTNSNKRKCFVNVNNL
ncbi:unnamed protein product [Brachionus calyciflorus]|uniref:Uncharacterized protein n=1 Tax=Brachionus calyciflorus TaxID=104777 RepID=A0A814HYQ4_9BILA|nr:unnamed protein product [Brachionus calyciflorus]